jgi:hypothetical protein
LLADWLVYVHPGTAFVAHLPQRGRFQEPPSLTMAIRGLIFGLLEMLDVVLLHIVVVDFSRRLGPIITKSERSVSLETLWLFSWRLPSGKCRGFVLNNLLAGGNVILIRSRCKQCYLSWGDSYELAFDDGIYTRNLVCTRHRPTLGIDNLGKGCYMRSNNLFSMLP